MPIAPAPIQTPLNQRGTLDLQQDSGKLTLPWIQWFNQLANAAGGGTGAASLVSATTMTADTTIASPATPSTGDILTVYVSQDATGGWVATFAATFKMVTSDDVDPSPLRTTILQFVGVSGEWWLGAAPFSRDTP